MPRAEEFAGAAYFEIAPGDFEAVGGGAHRHQTLLGDPAQRTLIQQQAGAGRRAAADPAAQLMQLRQPEPLGVLDHHQRRIRDIDADFDDGGRYQQMDVAPHERVHHFLLFLLFQAAVHQSDVQSGQRLHQRCVGIDGGLQLQRFGFFDQRADPIGLAAFQRRRVDPIDHLAAPVLVDAAGDDGRAAGR